MILTGVVEHSMKRSGLNFYNDWLSGCRAMALFAIYPNCRYLPKTKPKDY